jgi:hypothetical protein
MRKNSLYLTALCCSLFFACEKPEGSVETAVCSTYNDPGIYFPAHPGTYWVYDTPEAEIDSMLINDEPRKSQDQCYPYISEIGAFVNDNNLYTSVYTGMGSSHYEKSAIYSTELGFENWCVASFVNMTALTTLGSADEIKFRRVLIEKT